MRLRHFLFLCTFTGAAFSWANAQDPAAAASPACRLVFDISADPTLAPVTEKMDKAFKKHLAGMVAFLQGPGQKIPAEVTVKFEKGLNVPAATAGAKMSFSVEWFQKHPDDIGVIIHEFTHTLQAYPNAHPWWVTEGIADYIRGKFPCDDPKVWSLPKLNHTHKYDQGYRVTAAFLFWIEKTYPKSEIVKELNLAMKKKAYTEGIWKERTGKTVSELWQECLAAKPTP